MSPASGRGSRVAPGQRPAAGGQGRLLAQTTVAELSARSSSLEEAFFQLTEGSTEYSASYEAHYGTNYPLRSVS